MDNGPSLRKTHFKELACNTSPASVRHSTGYTPHTGHSISERSHSGKEMLWSAGPRCSSLITRASKLLGDCFTRAKA